MTQDNPSASAPPTAKTCRTIWVAAFLSFVVCGAPAAETNAIPDLLSEDAARFSALLNSVVPERRVEGIQGLSHLKHWPSEEALVRLTADPERSVRWAALQALSRVGGAASVARLNELLSDSSWETRQSAWFALRGITGRRFPVQPPVKWREWWGSSPMSAKLDMLLAETGVAGALPSNPAPDAAGDAALSQQALRTSALRALGHLATPDLEPALLNLLQVPSEPALTLEERALVCGALERVGTDRAVPVLAGVRTDAAAWALGRIGGLQAEKALLQFPKTLPVWLALDRVHSTNAGPFAAQLVAHMGLVTYRGQPDDVMNDDLQPIQRVAANLIRRSGRGPLLVELALQELEDSMQPPVSHGPRPECPPDWQRMLEAMRSELKPGFVREDGTTTSQPLRAMSLMVEDASLAPRLLPLLRHPAVVPRIYVAFALARLKAAQAAPALVGLIREGYSFSDATALASGKHFDQSQTVRWRGFLCMALGRLGGNEAREALEQFAVDAAQPRDIRYGAVVGLRFISSPNSVPSLRRVVASDVIWMIRHEAESALEQIEILALEQRANVQQAKR